MPPQPQQLHPSRMARLLAAIVRIQSLVAVIVGGTLALVFALGGQFGRVALSLALLAYGLGSLAYLTRATRRQPGALARGVELRAPEATPASRALSSSGRVIPIAGSLRRRSEPATDEFDQLAGR